MLRIGLTYRGPVLRDFQKRRAVIKPPFHAKWIWGQYIIWDVVATSFHELVDDTINDVRVSSTQHDCQTDEDA